MTAPKTAEKVCRGMPNQSAQVPYSRLSSTIVSPTSKNTARRCAIPALSTCSYQRTYQCTQRSTAERAPWDPRLPRHDHDQRHPDRTQSRHRTLIHEVQLADQGVIPVFKIPTNDTPL